MLLVKTSVRPSPIHGLGVFAEEDIEPGALIWKFMPGFDQLLPRSILAELPPVVRGFVERHCYVGESILFTVDHDHFINHSEAPNMHFDPTTMKGTALAWIRIGDEITQDYQDPGWPGDNGENFGK